MKRLGSTINRQCDGDECELTAQDRLFPQRDELHRVTSTEKQRRHKLKGLEIKLPQSTKDDEKNRAPDEPSQQQQGGWRVLKIQKQYSRWMLTPVDNSRKSSFGFELH